MNQPNVDQIKQATEEFAQNCGLTKEDFDLTLQQAREEMQNKPGMTPEMLDYYTYLRANQALKIRFTGNDEEVDAVVIAQHSAFDYAAKPRRERVELIKNEGLRVAIENGICDAQINPQPYYVDVNTGEISSMAEENGDVELRDPMTSEELSEFIYSAGLKSVSKMTGIDQDGKSFNYILLDEAGEYVLDENGNEIFVYTKPDFKAGQPMPLHDYNSVAYGFMKAPGDTDFKFASFTIRDNLATEPLPLFKPMKLGVKINKDKSTGSVYDAVIKKAPTMVADEYINFWDIEQKLKEAAPDRVLPALSNLEPFARSRKEFRSWCVVRGNILQVSIPTKPGVTSNALTISDHTMSALTADEREITLWIDKKIDLDMEEGALDAVFFVNSYVKQDGGVSYNCIGYWVDPIFRKQEAAALPTSNLNAWED